MKFSVCIPATRPAFLLPVITSIRRQTWHDWELIIVGQGDVATLTSAVHSAADGDERIRFVAARGQGISRSRNVAVAEAGGDVVAFTDDDCEADADWLRTIAAAFEADGGLGVVGGAVLAPPARGRLARCPSLVPNEAMYDPAANGRRPPPGWDWMGANFAIRTGVAQQIGPWDECLGAGAAFPAGDDTDYKLRLEAARVRMFTTPRSIVVHARGTRYGWRSVLASQAAYAKGNGATAAKLTLRNDPRGAQWLRDTRRAFALGWTRGVRPQRLLIDARRLWHFESAYRSCLRGYEVDGDGLLRARRRAFQPASAPVQRGTR
jgi:glycosyltransferase involved in cell wall biosynthesis